MTTLTRSRLWAKTDQSRQTDNWLSLDRHLNDTRAMSQLVWYHLVPEHVRQLLNQDCQGHAYELYQFLAGIHDVGKASPLFQSKIHNDTRYQWLNPPAPPQGVTAGQYRHETVSASSLTQWLNRQGITSRRNTDSLSDIIGAHHGWLNQPAIRMITQHQRMAVKAAGDTMWEQLRLTMITDKAKDCDYTPCDMPVPRRSAILLAGLISVADWMASALPLDPAHTNGTQSSNERAQQWWTQQNFADTPHLPQFTSEDWQRLFNITTPRPFQTAAIQQAAQSEGILILQAPMGEGKTEAALAAAQTLAHQHDMSGILWALPTRATVDAIVPRIQAWATNLNITTPVYVAHADADQDTNLPDWFHNKRMGLLAPVVAGTIDNVLTMGARGTYAALRHLGVASHVVVLDEVHAVDAYSTAYLRTALQWLGAYHTPVVVCSATLTDRLRTDLTNAWREGAGLPPVKEDHETEATVIRDSNSLIVPAASGRHVTVQTRIIPDTDERLLEIAHQAKQEGLVLAVIRDTVNRARHTYTLLQTVYSDSELLLTHSRYTLIDRTQHDQMILHKYGPTSRTRRGAVVGTQTLEQSLDVDFDIMISDAAPMDLLLQRAGRLHRHNRGTRPPAILYVTDPGKTGRYVYGDWTIDQTLRLLPQQLNLPKDISPLVEHAYTATNSETFTEWKTEQEAKYAQAQQATCLPPNLLDTGLGNWATNMKTTPPVRDIEPTIQLTLTPADCTNRNLIRQQTISIPVRTLPAANQLPKNKLRPWLRSLTLNEHHEAKIGAKTISYNHHTGMEIQ